MNIIDYEILDRLTAAARTNPRLRMNLNLHLGDDYCCHRFFNAIEPGSYIRPHRHLDPDKDETLVIIRGELGVFEFDDQGAIAGAAVLASGGDRQVADLPHGRFHCAVSLKPGTVFLEAKGGPYLPLTADELAPWSPVAGSLDVPEYLTMLIARLQV